MIVTNTTYITNHYSTCTNTTNIINHYSTCTNTTNITNHYSTCTNTTNITNHYSTCTNTTNITNHYSTCSICIEGQLSISEMCDTKTLGYIYFMIHNKLHHVITVTVIRPVMKRKQVLQSFLRNEGNIFILI